MVGIDGRDENPNRRSRGGGDEVEGSDGADFDNPKQGDVESGKPERNEAGRDRGAKERTAAPGGGEARGVVIVEVSKEVRLAPLAPLVD